MTEGTAVPPSVARGFPVAAAFAWVASLGVGLAATFAAGTPPEVRSTLAAGLAASFLAARWAGLRGGDAVATGGESALWLLACLAALMALLAGSLDAGATWRWALLLGGLACLSSTMRGVVAAGGARWIARGVALAAIAHAAIGIVHGRYAEDDPLIGGFVTQGSGLTAYGTFPNQGQFAAFLLLSLGPAFVLAARESAWPDRLLGWATIGGVGVGTWLSSSRAGVLGFALGAAAGFVVAGERGRRGRRLACIGAGLAALVGARLAGFAPLVAATTPKVGESRRFQIWKGTLDLAAEQPLVGVGFGAFPYAYPDPGRPIHDRHVTNAENEGLALAAEGGLVGLAIAAAGIVFGVRRVRRVRASAGPGERRSFALGLAGLAALLPSLATATPLHAPAIAAGAVLAWAAVAGTLCAPPAMLPRSGTAV